MSIEYRRTLRQRILFLPPSEIKIPDVVNLTIPQPKGVEIHISGPKDNCEVIFESPEGKFSFNEIPPETRFEFHDSSFRGFTHKIRDDEHVIRIPPTKKWQEGDPVLALFHEKGHTASQQDPEWLEELKQANKEIWGQLFWRQIDGSMWTSDEAEKREQERAAMAVFGQEERRASAYALWQVRQLRKKGIDPVPHRKTLKELKGNLERAIKAHAHPEFGISVVREKPSVWQRFRDKLLRIPLREGNAAVYIPRWEDVRKRRIFRASLETLGWMSGAAAIGALTVEVISYTALGQHAAPGLVVAFALQGVLWGGLFSLDFVKWR